MNVMTTQGGVFGGNNQVTDRLTGQFYGNTSWTYAAGQLLEIPAQYYNSFSMTRVGTSLSNAQLRALIPWSLYHPGTAPINGE